MKKKRAQRRKRRKEIGSTKRAQQALDDYVKLIKERETELEKQKALIRERGNRLW